MKDLEELKRLKALPLTVGDAIRLLQEQDLTKPLYIQQGEEHDFMQAYDVIPMELWDVHSLKDDDTINAVVITYF